MLFGQADSLEMKVAPNTTNSDSLLNAYAKSVLSIKVMENPLASRNLEIDSMKLEKKNFFQGLNGQIGVGYEFGLLTGYIEPENFGPLSVFNTQGDMNAEALGLPFQVSYNYSSMKNPLGVNNYFRVSLDAERLRQKAKDKENLAKGKLDESLQSLKSEKGNLSSKLGMGEVLLQKMKRELNVQKRELEAAVREKVQVDTLSYSTDSLPQNEKYQKLQENYDKSMQMYDSLQGLYNKVQKIYTLYDRYQTALENRKGQLEGLS